MGKTASTAAGRFLRPLVGLVAAGMLSVAATAITAPTTAIASPTHPTAKTPPIVGGQPAGITGYPWTVYLADPQGNQFCGGTLVRANKVVTAAHCVKGEQPPGVQVVAGRADTHSSAGTVAQVSGIWVHPQFQSPEAGADVAVLTLAKRLPQRPLALASRQDIALYRAGTMATVLGWGATSEGAGPSPILRKANPPVVSDRDCSATYGAQYNARAMVCAGRAEGGVDSCQGDSGGPLVVADKLIGIVSWGEGCARPGTPGVYTRVATYHDEILPQLGS